MNRICDVEADRLPSLAEGIHRFWPRLFSRAGDGDVLVPEFRGAAALFIACCEANGHVERWLRGCFVDLYVVRNWGNIIPPVGSDDTSYISGIAHALANPEVSEIVVCGHLSCTLIDALLDEPPVLSAAKSNRLPPCADVTRRLIQANYDAQCGSSRSQIAIQEHVLMQLENILKYTGFHLKLALGKVCFRAWVHDEPSEQLHVYHHASGQFEPWSDFPKSGE
jgi:carbonic anhydrase